MAIAAIKGERTLTELAWPSTWTDGPIAERHRGLKLIIDLCVPKIRFCNIGDEGRRGQAVM